MKKIIGIIVYFLFATISYSQITVTLSPTAKTLNPSLIGLNGRSTEGPSWTNNGFLSLVNELSPAYVRYPAGTQGNEWNWMTGQFIPGYGNNANFPFTIPMLVNGIPSTTKIIYMVNMVLPTPQTGITYATSTDAVLRTDATLNAKIADIMNALLEFKNNGHLPEVVELGNELYFSNAEAGVYANDPAFYLSHAKVIAAAIKATYPQIKIILCTTKGGTNSRDAWNSAVYNKMSSDATFKSYVYGVVQHHYINASYGYQGAVTDLASAKTIITEGQQYAQDILSDYNAAPTSLKLWLTEYGATKTNADEMWAAGLRTATMSLSLMQLGEKIDNMMWHHITDDPNIINKTLLTLGPSGMAFSLLSSAMMNKTSVKKLVFSNKLVTDPLASLFGFKFEGNNSESIIIVNTDETTYAGVNLSALFIGTAVSAAIQYWSSTPFVTPVYTGNNISVSTATSISNYTIRPFSITVVKMDNITAIKKPNNEIRPSVYPIHFSDEITVNSRNQEIVSSIQISDINGRKIVCLTPNSTKAVIYTSSFRTGVYLIEIACGGKKQLYRVFKTN